MAVNFIKVLNKEKILEFKKNNSSGFDESEIILQNISNDNIISKIYINNYTHFKCLPNIAILNKDSIKKIKVIIDDKDYQVSESDVFLIISNPINDKEILKNETDNKQLNEYFKKNNFKECGQKIFMIGYKEEENENNKKVNNDELISKINELEKQVYEQKEIKEKNVKENLDKKITELNNNQNRNIAFYIGFSLLILCFAFILYRLFK